MALNRVGIHHIDTSFLDGLYTSGKLSAAQREAVLAGANPSTLNLSPYDLAALTHCQVLIVLLSSDTPSDIGTAAAGEASTVARADHVHALPDTGSAAGTTSYPVSITVDSKGRVTAATAGSAPAALGSSTPADIGTAAAGAASTAARADHVHALPDTGSAAGTTSYPVSITVDAKGRVTAATAGSAPAALGSSTPADIGTAAAGAASTAARADHVHALPDTGSAAGTTSYPVSITVDAKGRVIAATAGSAPPSLITASVSLSAASHNVTGSWADIGLELSLDAGTWLVTAEVLGFCKTNGTPAAGDEGMAIRLHNATAAAPLANSERPLKLLDEGTVGGYGQGVVTEVVTVGTTSSIRAQATDVGGSVALATAQVHSNSTFGRTRMSALRLG